MANVIKVIEKNVGKKIDFEQDGTRLYLGDDEIMINCAKYQKDWPVQIDVCSDKSGNLVTGTEKGLKYVAQIDIPAASYEDGENDEERMKADIDMADVTLTLWSIE